MVSPSWERSGEAVWELLAEGLAEAPAAEEDGPPEAPAADEDGAADARVGPSAPAPPNAAGTSTAAVARAHAIVLAPRRVRVLLPLLSDLRWCPIV
jgi:hypothetical protein